MSTSEGRASKKAKIVDNEFLDGDSSDGVDRIICVYLVHHPGKYLLVRGTYTQQKYMPGTWYTPVRTNKRA